MHTEDFQHATSDPAEVEKVRSLMDSMDIAMLTTVDMSQGTMRLLSRPLSTQVAEKDGDVLFLVRSSSDVAAAVRENPQVNVAYSSNKAWVSLSGTAEVVSDRALVEELWTKGAGMFMDGGPENPDNVVLKVHGDTAHYWGGGSLVGTAVKTVRSMLSDSSSQEDSGSKVVDLP